MRQIAVITGLLIIISSSVVHGVMTDRWYERVDFNRLNTIIETFPKEFGDWSYREEAEPLSEFAIGELQAKAHLSRTYQRASGESVQLLLIVGKPGPLIRHEPELCYTSSGKRLGSTDTIALKKAGYLRGLTFSPLNASQSPFAVGYGYISTNKWSCPDATRVVLGGESFLFKIQVLTEIPKDNSAKAFSTIADFMDALSAGFQQGIADSMTQRTVTAQR